jgi:RNA polymerase sigma-70 factor (ECF subfamily)
MILKADESANNANKYNSGMNYTPIVAINAINANGVFINQGIRE